ncbi:terminase large subunit domain-containing protein [Gemmata palustris]|nr:terminase family protein [Gemmata palustris]
MKGADPWQAALLRSHWAQCLLLASRQVGKSETSAAAALHTVLARAGALVLITAPSQRQAIECFRKAAERYERLGRPVPGKVNATFMELANGSRLLAVPGSEKTIRGFSAVSLLVVDEAARVPDALMAGVRPMLAVSGGRLLACTTAFGKRGWFYDAYSGSEPWYRLRITADKCPRITSAFLESERKALGERHWKQEYFCSFEDAEGAVFDTDDILAAGSDEAPFFEPARPRGKDLPHADFPLTY